MAEMMRIALNLIGSGKEDQSFLDAKWIQSLLTGSPSKFKRNFALSVLSWSPHYFYRNISRDYASLTHREFTEKEFERNKRSRENIYNIILSSHLSANDAVLDYGCGPGFLAKCVSDHVRAVYAVDLSNGALACARILNGAPNINFLHTSRLDEIANGSLDAIYSFAVIQHVTDETLQAVLETMHRKLKSGGKILLHIVVDDKNWRTEAEWRSDKSLKGRLKWSYGLNCFSRRHDDVIERVAATGFSSIDLQPIRERYQTPADNKPADDIWAQHFLYALKA